MKYFLKVLVVACFFFAMASCSKPYNRARWCGTEYMDRFYIDNSRYKMARWLMNNYEFNGKSYDELIEKFGYPASDRTDSSTMERVLKYPVKQKNPNFIMGIDPPIDLAQMVVTFRDDKVVQVAIVRRKNKSETFDEITFSRR